MQLRSSLIYHSTTEVIGTKAASEGGLVQRDKHDDFELKPVNDDGLNQSIASDVVKSKPVNVDGVDRSRAPSNNFDLNYRESLHALGGRVRSCGRSYVYGRSASLDSGVRSCGRSNFIATRANSNRPVRSSGPIFNWGMEFMVRVRFVPVGMHSSGLLPV